MVYLKTFLITAPLFGLFYHWMATQAMPWWPDTVIMGGFMGAMASLVWLRFRPTLLMYRLLWRGGKAVVARVRPRRD